MIQEAKYGLQENARKLKQRRRIWKDLIHHVDTKNTQKNSKHKRGYNQVESMVFLTNIAHEQP
jgi:hypothetical protein